MNLFHSFYKGLLYEDARSELMVDAIASSEQKCESHCHIYGEISMQGQGMKRDEGKIEEKENI